ncbi:MAG: hypothetical protein ABI039_08845, partial [Vicinamibacterales bacterium]
RDAAVKKLLSMAIKAAKAKGKYIGICGQGPSDHPDLADWLMARSCGPAVRSDRRNSRAACGR